MSIMEHRGGIEAERLHAYERQLGVELPQDYRDFLLEKNGGYPEPGALAIPGTSDVTQVSRFLALDGELWDDLEVYRDRYEGRVPPGWLPIGYDGFGNLLLLGMIAANRGFIAFWNHELESDDPAEATLALVPLCAGFTAFLGLLSD